jgi:alpha-tubulin suppressor-like RCC1 family protein
MTHPARSWLAGALLFAAACTDARTPLAPEPPAPAPFPALQAVACTLDRGEAEMRCVDPQPSTGSALGSGGVIVGGQNVYVRLASSNVTWQADTLRLDVTVQNLLDQPLGTADGTTPHAGGVRVFFSDGPTAHPTGTAWVANADGDAYILAPGQPYFTYGTLLRPDETSAPRTWKMAYTPGTTRVTFTVYVAAQVQHEGERLVVTPDETFLLLGDTLRLEAALRDFAGRTRPARVTWRSNDDRIATVDSTGLLTGVREGLVVIHATTEDGKTAHSTVKVITPQTVVDVRLVRDTATLEMGHTVQLSAVAYNVRGEVLNTPLSYAEDNPWAAYANQQTGLVRATHPGTSRIHVGLDWGTDTAYITTLPGPEVTWRSVTTGQGHTCGVSTANKAYCWGHNGAGQLGFGVMTAQGEMLPAGVAGGTEFALVDGGNWFTCGLSTGGQAWCWGNGYYGQRGDGQEGYTDGEPTPQAVVGGHTFTTLSAGFEHACALDEGGKAWCWGNNTYGQLGNDERVIVYGEPVPVEVVGGLTFKQISAGRDATCAITPDDLLYCWGDNEIGQFGDGAGAPGLMVPHPVPAGGGMRYRDIALGDSHVCGITTAGEAFCWGEDHYGELGTGVAEVGDDVPMKVAAAQTFTDIGVGSYHTCAVATDGVAWCWGFNRVGQLGRAEKESFDPNPVPEPVVSAVRFAGSMEGGFQHTCAIGTDDKAYCWGADFHGEGGIQPDTEWCKVPGGVAACNTVPTVVSNPAAGGARTGYNSSTYPPVPNPEGAAHRAGGPPAPLPLPPVTRTPPRRP